LLNLLLLVLWLSVVWGDLLLLVVCLELESRYLLLPRNLHYGRILISLGNINNDGRSKGVITRDVVLSLEESK
jgi:hypothetical protein